MLFIRKIRIPILLIFTVAILLLGLFITSLMRGKAPQEIISPFIEILKNEEKIKSVQEDPLAKKEVFGFLPYWMLKNHQYIRYDLLTTIAYFGLHIDGQGEFVKTNDDGNSELGWLNWQKNNQLDQIIKEAKGKKVRVALTVVAQDNAVLEDFLNCRPCWDTLITNSLLELKKKNISDLNLDFEYQGVPEEALRDQYSEFVKRVTQKVHEEIPNSQVSVDTYAEAAYKTKLHDIKALADASDILFIMAYDFHRLTGNKTGPIAPLKGAPDKYKYDLTLMLRDYLRFAPKEKLIMGVAYYGYDWLTEDEKLGSFRIPGNENIGFSHVSYYGECEYHEENKREQKRWDEDAQAPWFYYYDNDHQVFRQCHYENKQALAAKYDFIIDNNLRGVGIWALGYDGKFPELWELLEEKFK